MEDGTRRFDLEVRRLDDHALAEPSMLPSWSRAHVVAHVARNADALDNLLTWARTGIETPMYADDDQREAEIDATALLLADELRSELEHAARRFATSVASLPVSAWNAEVRTRSGRTIPAREVLWMRCREVWVHAVDLASGTSFADFPPELLRALLSELAGTFTTRRDCDAMDLIASDLGTTWSIGPEGTEGQPSVQGRAADIVAWLLGRADGVGLVSSTGLLPVIPAWL
jgi:maleylpyruvate isomerase